MIHSERDLRAARLLAIVLVGLGLLLVCVDLLQGRFTGAALGTAFLSLGSALAFKLRRLRQDPVDRDGGLTCPPAESPADRMGAISRPALAFVAFAAFVLAVPGYVYCAFSHICMDGHFGHPPYSPWDFANDVGWITSLSLSILAAAPSGVRCRSVFVVACGALITTRVLFESGGGGLFLVEFPLLLLAATVMALNSCSPGKSTDQARAIERV